MRVEKITTFRKDNPFSQFRAENMGNDLWRLYVPGPLEKLLNPRPLILEGGRGSGKTMFFLCNSWRERITSLKANGQAVSTILNPTEFIGVYYKVDSGFAKFMVGNGTKNWDGVFNTYLATCIIQDLLEFLQELFKAESIPENNLSPIFACVKKLIPNDINVSSISEALSVCETTFDRIEDLINSSVEDVGIRRSVPGRLVNEFVQKIRLLPGFESLCVRVFIDEYETLLEYQQKIINLLIKGTESYLIYNIGMRPKGMLTSSTPNCGDIIQSPHDYTHFRIENLYDGEDRDTLKNDYTTLLAKICEKRIAHFLNAMRYSEAPTDIQYYLGEYDADTEIKFITENKAKPTFYLRLRQLISSLERNPETAQSYMDLLIDKASPVNVRLHLCLLNRVFRYRPTLDELANAYKDWLNSKQGPYDEWYQHSKVGLAFLLAHEYKSTKQYCGFKTYAMLSAGVVRYFLELCEQAFDMAMTEDFNWSNPVQISAEIQTKAAYYVSRYKFNDIDGYEPYAHKLKLFTEHLGEMFKLLHLHENLSMGEPEPNHFSTDDSALSEEDRKVLNSAIMWAILQERESTKEKDSNLARESKDYHLNHIYAPYFGISYRKKHKIFINKEDLNYLLSGNDKLTRTITNNLLRKLEKKAFENGPPVTEQLTILDGGGTQ